MHHPGGLLLCIGGERASRDEQALVAATCHGATEIADGARANAAAVALALKDDRETHQAKVVDAEPIDAAVTAPAGDIHAIELSLTKQPPRESLKSVRRDAHEAVDELLFPVVVCGRLGLVRLVAAPCELGFARRAQVSQVGGSELKEPFVALALGEGRVGYQRRAIFGSAQTPRELLVRSPIPLR